MRSTTEPFTLLRPQHKSVPMPTQAEAQQRLVRAIYRALDRLWPMSAATRRAAAEAIVHEVYNVGVRVELERRTGSRRGPPPLVPATLLLSFGLAVLKLELMTILG